MHFSSQKYLQRRKEKGTKRPDHILPSPWVAVWMLCSQWIQPWCWAPGPQSLHNVVSETPWASSCCCLQTFPTPDTLHGRYFLLDYGEYATKPGAKSRKGINYNFKKNTRYIEGERGYMEAFQLSLYIINKTFSFSSVRREKTVIIITKTMPYLHEFSPDRLDVIVKEVRL